MNAQNVLPLSGRAFFTAKMQSNGSFLHGWEENYDKGYDAGQPAEADPCLCSAAHNIIPDHETTHGFLSAHSFHHLFPGGENDISRRSAPAAHSAAVPAHAADFPG